MPVFRRNHDYKINIADLKRKFNLCLLELQLIWLFEILNIMSFIHYSDLDMLSDFKTNNEDNYLLNGKNITDYIIDSKLNVECFKVLTVFRNKYVHSGASEAFKEFKDLITTYHNELCDLAKFAEVELSTNFIIYRDLISKKV